MTKIIVATGNENKMNEIRQIIKCDNIQFVSLKDEGLQDIEIVEDGKTFEENAVRPLLSRITPGFATVFPHKNNFFDSVPLGDMPLK